MGRKLLSFLLSGMILFTEIPAVTYAAETYVPQTEIETEKRAEQAEDQVPETGTEKTTEKSSDQGTEKGTEKPTEKSTEADTEKPTEKGTDASAEPVTEQKAEPTTEPTTEATTEPTTPTGEGDEGAEQEVMTESGSENSTEFAAEGDAFPATTTLTVSLMWDESARTEEKVTNATFNRKMKRKTDPDTKWTSLSSDIKISSYNPEKLVKVTQNLPTYDDQGYELEYKAEITEIEITRNGSAKKVAIENGEAGNFNVSINNGGDAVNGYFTTIAIYPKDYQAVHMKVQATKEILPDIDHGQLENAVPITLQFKINGDASYGNFSDIDDAARSYLGITGAFEATKSCTLSGDAYSTVEWNDLPVCLPDVPSKLITYRVVQKSIINGTNRVIASDNTATGNLWEENETGANAHVLLIPDESQQASINLTHAWRGESSDAGNRIASASFALQRRVLDTNGSWENVQNASATLPKGGLNSNDIKTAVFNGLRLSTQQETASNIEWFRQALH